MAVNKRKAVFVVTYLCPVLLLCMLTSQTEANVARVRRQGCTNGAYKGNDGRSCCKCPAGYKVKTHCTDHAQTECEECPKTEYQSHASEQTTCERCTSCAHPNANLEVDIPCTPIHDSTCKCKSDHYCSSGKTPCKVCEPCQVCGPEGKKVACSATNNTICNDKPKDNSLAIALGVIIPLLAAAGAAAVYFFWRKKQSGNKTNENGHLEPENVLLQPNPEPVPAKSLGPCIYRIAEEIGWTTMRNLAMKSEIPDGIIESCEAKNDRVESTIALLRFWDEKEGRNASSKLIQYLKETNQNSKAEKVSEILRSGSK